MGSRMNAGYLITDSIHIGTTEFVLGVSIAERSMFVTWACQGSDYYYWAIITPISWPLKRTFWNGPGRNWSTR